MMQTSYRFNLYLCFFRIFFKGLQSTISSFLEKGKYDVLSEDDIWSLLYTPKEEPLLADQYRNIYISTRPMRDVYSM